MKIITLAVVVLAAMTASAKNVSFRHIVSGSQTAATVATHLSFARDSHSFERLWRNISGKSDWPPIDFKKEGAIIITAGRKPTAGYSIKVNGITKVKGALVVDAEVVSPPAGSFNAEVLTSPYVVVAVPKAGVSTARWKNPPKK